MAAPQRPTRPTSTGPALPARRTRRTRRLRPTTGAAPGTSSPSPPRHRRPTPEQGLALGVAAVATVAGVWLVRDGTTVGDGPPQPSAAAAVSHSDRDAAAAAARPGTARRALPSPLPASPPVRIRIPAIRVDAPVRRVALDRDGWIAPPPPRETNQVGWFGGSPAPGGDGAAVVVGHVDNETGPVVFYRLGALEKGEVIHVSRRDGRTVEFVVYGVEVFDKRDFPGERVYRRGGPPELRLITCGGGYSRETGYRGNVVVFARMTAGGGPARTLGP